MTIRKTVAVSLVFHCLIVYGALLAIKNASMGERIFFVDIQASAPGDALRRGDPVEPVRAEPGKKLVASAVKKKKTVSPTPDSEKNTDSRADERVGESAPEPAPALAGEATSPAIQDTQQGSAGMGGQESLEGVKDGLSVSLYDHAGTSTSSAPAGKRSGALNLIQQVRAAIERAKTYPDLARKRRQEGAVLVEFSINGKGLPENIRIVRSSGFGLLDAAAKETVVRAAPLPAVKGSIEVLITFMLKER